MNLSEGLQFIDDIQKRERIILKMISNDEMPVAFSIIAMVIDEYAALHNIKGDEAWEILNTVSKAVRNEFGDCEYMKEGEHFD